MGFGNMWSFALWRLACRAISASDELLNETHVPVTYTDAVVETLKAAGHHDDVTCSRVRDVLLAPHKHKDRTARKAKQSGQYNNSKFTPPDLALLGRRVGSCRAVRIVYVNSLRACVSTLS